MVCYGEKVLSVSDDQSSTLDLSGLSAFKSSLRRLMKTFLVVLLLPALLLAQKTFTGHLESDLVVPPRSHQTHEFKLATEVERDLLGDAAKPADRVFAGDVRGSLAFVVERDGAPARLFVDLNGDGRISPDEAFSLVAYDADARLVAGIVDLRFPLPGPGYKWYPVRVYVYRAQQRPDSRIVGESPRAFVHGSVDINGRSILVEIEFDRGKHAAFADSGWQGMDADGDGTIDTRPGSLEYVFAKDERPVFRVGGDYVSVRSLDLEHREFVLESRSAAAYARIEIVAGNVFPDFAFRDFDGRERKLSDFHGKFVLLDFWATWCAPCVADLPSLVSAYDRFRGTAFEILGMDVDEDLEKARAMVAEKRLRWIQADFSSIRELVERRARIAAYPTYVLLDGERRIIASGFEAFHDGRLISTLEKYVK